jgi:hypothetical protein
MDSRIVCTTYSEYLMKVKEIIGGGEFSKENGGSWFPQDDPSKDCFGIMFYKMVGKEEDEKEITYHLLVPRLAVTTPVPDTNPLFQDVFSVYEIVQHNLHKEIKRVMYNGVNMSSMVVPIDTKGHKDPVLEAPGAKGTTVTP